MYPNVSARSPDTKHCTRAAPATQARYERAFQCSHANRLNARHARHRQRVISVLAMLTAVAIQLQYDVPVYVPVYVLVYVRIAALFPSLKGR
ncbi:hypothetical protein GCM10011400_57220 [Paraburkholderia caffeinilytica]|uniref:Uncharacterized protein n=1 Tax=Paraburkholderia caffeinilytica TaxID=1761016 RepID=A0ABQ1N9S0_9BURK|nr:hypothetical protein GCM10011400_57220 [Paraburkholderia caffeinilytica]